MTWIISKSGDLSMKLLDLNDLKQRISDRNLWEGTRLDISVGPNQVRKILHG